MDNALAITIIFIVLSTVVAAFIRRRKRDKCLNDFSDDMVTVAQTSGKTIHGKLRVENTGLELIYSAAHQDEDGHEETSFILYKYEYPDIQALIRYHDELSQSGKEQREQELQRTYHPGAWRRLKRKTLNVFKTIRDSVAEVVNLLISHAKKTTPVGGTLTSQDKYVSQMKQELMGSVGTSYEPLLEKYIGHKVVLELLKGDKVFEYCGVLKEYTAEFIEIMDVDYRVNQEEAARKADLVALRKYGLIRHLGE
jgi:small nuclear ribonucleoprotein (snRNP)-like protein